MKRREFLRGVAATGLGVSLAACASEEPETASPTEATAAEEEAPAAEEESSDVSVPAQVQALQARISGASQALVVSAVKLT